MKPVQDQPSDQQGAGANAPKPDDFKRIPRRASRLRRWSIRLAIVLVLLLIAGELTARFYFGLGDPPLSMADPEIEYLFKPDQDCKRFGRHIKYNHYSMRGDDFSEPKVKRGAVRILVLGDSVVNGGVLTDQDELATSIMQKELPARIGAPVDVGNISAGSWGPPNQLAYLKRYGFFDADAVVMVFSSHDAFDAPTFEPAIDVVPSLPSSKPISALWEGITRYLIPKITGKGLGLEGPPVSTPAASAEAAQIALEKCLAAEREMIRLVKSKGAIPIVALHMTMKEQAGPLDPGHDLLAKVAREEGATIIELGPRFKSAISDGGPNPYRDDIHPDARGQRIIADTLDDALMALLRRK